jgi:antitoxin component YwqK of YwqJK toxin-antitoxin module
MVIWGFDGNCEYVGAWDSLELRSIIESSKFESDSAILVYIGHNISNPEKYELPVTAISVEIHNYGDSKVLNINNFFPYNDTLENLLKEGKDTMLIDYCFKSRDILPDGKWRRYIRNNEGLYLREEKNISGGLIDGNFIVWHPIGEIANKGKTSNGFLLESVSYRKDGTISEISKYKCNVIIEKYAFSNCDKNINTLVYYYNYNWGSIAFKNGKMLYFCPEYKGVSHGEMKVFNEKGEVIKITKYNYGIEQK